MKKNITIIAITLSTLLILDSMNFSHALMMFLLAGVIPFTNITIDGAQMLEFIFIVAGFLFARITLYIGRNIKLRQTKSTRAHA